MTSPQLVPNKHQERSMRTRALLLDATIECLAEDGYANTSTSAVAARAGLTRGAHIHHFRTRTELFGQAIDHLEALQRSAVRDAAQVGGASGPADQLVDVVTAAFSGHLGKASIELFVAIRNDDELREHMLRAQSQLTRHMLDTCADLVGEEVPHERLETTFWMTINQVRGVVMDVMIGRDPHRPEKLISEWRRLAARSLEDY